MNDTQTSEALAHSILTLLKKDEDYIEALEKPLNIYSKAKELFKKSNPNKNMGDFLNSHKVMSYIIGAMKESGKEI